jgi:AraC family transcriptional regulator
MLETERGHSGGVLWRRYAHRANGRRRFATAAHAELEIAWVERGGAGYQAGRSEYELGAGPLMVVPPTTEHATTFASGLVACSVHVNAEVAYDIAASLGAPLASEPLLVCDAMTVMTVVSLARMIEGEARREAPGGQQLMVDALVEAMLVAVLRQLRGRGRDERVSGDPRIARAVELVHARFCEALTIADLAQAAGMSRYHFSRRFRAELGVSPYRFVQQVRIQRARELLRSQQRSVTQVALAVGFTDLARFAIAFRAQVGMLPSEVAGTRGRRAAC